MTKYTKRRDNMGKKSIVLLLALVIISVILLNAYIKIDANVSDLFSNYNWTVSHRINTVQIILPKSLNHKAGEFPKKPYFALNCELSKEIGLDFSEYVGKAVNAEIYKLEEKLPNGLDARGVVLKDSGKIIGAYIEAEGAKIPFGCALNGKSIKDIAGKGWEDWILGSINYDDEFEILLSKLSPKDIINEYFNAVDSNDEQIIFATLTRRKLCEYLTMNKSPRDLINEKGNIDNIVKKVKVLEIKETNDDENTKSFEVLADFVFKKANAKNNGEHKVYITLRKENEKLGWKIDNIEPNFVGYGVNFENILYNN